METTVHFKIDDVLKQLGEEVSYVKNQWNGVDFTGVHTGVRLTWDDGLFRLIVLTSDIAKLYCYGVKFDASTPVEILTAATEEALTDKERSK